MAKPTPFSAPGRAIPRWGDFTADDVHATFSRLIFPPKGFSSPRTPLFSTVEAINVRDTYTIEFKLRESRPTDFMLGAFASGWNIIVRKKTLEDNNYSLRRVEAFPYRPVQACEARR